MTAGPTPGSELRPYQESTQDSYAEWAADTFTVQETEPGVILLHGRCPQCQANIEIIVVTIIFASRRRLRSWLRPDRAAAPDAEIEQPVMCTCQDEHPGRPDGRIGCGAYWMMIIASADA